MTAKERWWTAYAAGYDELWNSFSWLWNEVARLLHAGAVLDVGSGTGAFANVARANGHDVVAVDNCAAMLDRNCSGSRRVRATGTALPFPSMTFDNVVLTNVLHLADDAERILREAARVTATGGALIVTVPPDELGLPRLARAEHAIRTSVRGLVARAVRRLWWEMTGLVAGIRRRSAEDVARLVSDLGWPPMQVRWPHSDVQLVFAVQRPKQRRGEVGVAAGRS